MNTHNSISITIPSKENEITSKRNRKSCLSYSYSYSLGLENKDKWSSIIYEVWDIKYSSKYLFEQIEKLDTNINELESKILNIEEGINLLKNIDLYTHYILDLKLKEKQRILIKKRITINKKRDKIINLIDVFVSCYKNNDKNIIDIDKAKRKLNSYILNLKKIGANNKDIFLIGQKLKILYSLSLTS